LRRFLSFSQAQRFPLLVYGKSAEIGTMSAGGCPSDLPAIPLPQPVNKHLFQRLVGHQDMADGVATNEMADFFGNVLGVIAGAFE
jgi:hypothetical protein